MPARLLILTLLTAMLLASAYLLFQRVVLAVLVVMVILLSSGCAFRIVPSFPGGRICYPANSWKCSPNVEWADM